MTEQTRVLKITVFYYEDNGISLEHQTIMAQLSDGGRAIIPQEFKRGRSIVLVCEGDVKVLNKLGDRLNDSLEHIQA